MKPSKSRSKNWMSTLRDFRSNRTQPKTNKMRLSDSLLSQKQPKKKWKISKSTLKIKSQNLRISCKAAARRLRKRGREKDSRKKKLRKRGLKKKERRKQNLQEQPSRRLKRQPRRKKKLRKQRRKLKRTRQKPSLQCQWSRQSAKLILAWITLTDQPH